jgi:hypothetical protein
MTVDIWIRDYNHSMCFQKKISGRGKHNGLGLANAQDERFTPFLVIKIKRNDLKFELGIIILQGVSRRKSLAGLNKMSID